MASRGIKRVSTINDLVEYENRAEQEAQQLALSQLADVDSVSDIYTRQALASEDLNGGALVNTSDPVFETTGQDSTGWYDWYAIEDNNAGEDKGFVFWGLQWANEDETASIPFTTLRITDSTGGLLDLIDLTGIEVADNGTILIDNPISSSTQDLNFELYDSDASDTDTYELVPLMTVGEEAGDTLQQNDARFIR